MEYNIGDEIIINHDVYNNISFIVIGVDHDADNSITLLSKDIVLLGPFDSAEGEEIESELDYDLKGRGSFGNNNYGKSNILQWMNSDDTKCGWYYKSHKYDNPPIISSIDGDNELFNRDGLLHGFDNNIKNNIIPVNKKVILCDGEGNSIQEVKSKIFLLSASEVGLNESIEEGKVYPYFKSSHERKAYLSNYARENCKLKFSISNPNNKLWNWWLRTCNSFSPYYSGFVGVNGEFMSLDSYNSNIGIRFAFCINKNAFKKNREILEIKEYDSNGNLIYYKDSKGYEYWYEYDSSNNLIHYKNSKGFEYWYEYDENNNRIHYKDSDGKEVWREYDSNNNLIHYKDSDGYEYDANGNLIRKRSYPNNKKNIIKSIVKSIIKILKL